MVPPSLFRQQGMGFLWNDFGWENWEVRENWKVEDCAGSTSLQIIPYTAFNQGAGRIFRGTCGVMMIQSARYVYWREQKCRGAAAPFASPFTCASWLQFDGLAVKLGR